MRLRTLVFLVVLAVVAAVGVATWRGAGPLPDPEGCSATLAGHRVDLDPEQARYATLIAALGVRRGLPARAVSIALATAYQESKIRNLTHGDRDSLGLFQQRPSQGWGTTAQVRDPYHATNAFYDGLAKVPNYRDMRITEAAQRVQRSGFPEAYQAHAQDARTLASVLTGFSPGGHFTCVVRESQERGTRAAVASDLAAAFGSPTVVPGARQDLDVVVGRGEAGRRQGWAVAQYLLAHAGSLHVRTVGFHGRRWQTGTPSEQGWRPAGAGRAPVDRVRVSLG
ncbi:heavy metal transporter [Nocardioides korecus]